MAEPWTPAGILRTHAARRPDCPMIAVGSRAITWSEMRARASRLAQALRAEGVGAQDRVPFVERNAPEYFEILFGDGMLNAVNVAVNWRLAPREMAYIINDAGAKVLFVGPDFLAHLAEIEGALTSVRAIVVLGDHSRYSAYEPWLGRYPDVDPMDDVAPGEAASSQPVRQAPRA